jgi:flagellar hook-length control protein FliK
MDIVHLLSGPAAKTPLAGKPTGTAEPGQFASVLEEATNVHGTPGPGGLTLLAAAAAPRAAATVNDVAGQPLRTKLAPADLLAPKDAKSEGGDAPQAGPGEAQEPEAGDARKPGSKADSTDKGKHARAGDAAAPNTPIAAAINAALAAVAFRNGQTTTADAGKATASDRTAEAAPGKIAKADPRGAGSRHQFGQLQQIAQTATTAAGSSQSGADAGASGSGQGFASQLLAAADAPRATAPMHADNGAASSAVNALFSTHAAPQAAAPASAPAMASTAVLQAPVGSAPWQNELGQQLIRFSQRGDHQIELHLHPKELGPLQISLHVNDQQVAQAHFFAAHAQVRDAVQQAIPQLREALAGQGIALGEAMVGQQQQQHQDFASFGGSSASPSFGGATEVESIAAARPVSGALPRIGPGGVDLYA